MSSLITLTGSLFFALMLMNPLAPMDGGTSADLGKFLEQHGRKTDWQHLRDVSHYFIETRIRKSGSQMTEGLAGNDRRRII